MATPTSSAGACCQVLDNSIPAVARMRQLVGGGPDPSDPWEAVLGGRRDDVGPGPAHARRRRPRKLRPLPGGDGTTVLIPGCGAGHDVVALSGGGRFVVGLDISETAMHNARQDATAAAADGNLPSSFDFVAADFFTWEPPEKFDVIFDYTFFCAIEPSMRPAWAKRIDQLLKPDGELVTLMYLVGGLKSGPPFNTAVTDYEELLNPLGFVMYSIQDNEVAVQSRKGMEKMARWKRTANPTA